MLYVIHGRELNQRASFIELDRAQAKHVEIFWYLTFEILTLLKSFLYDKTI